MHEAHRPSPRPLAGTQERESSVGRTEGITIVGGGAAQTQESQLRPTVFVFDREARPPDEAYAGRRQRRLPLVDLLFVDAAHREGIRAYVEQLDQDERQRISKAFDITA